MKPNYTRIMRTMTTQPWAVLPQTLDTICAIIEARANGAPSFTTEEIRAQMGARAAAGTMLQGGGAVAVIPLVGVLAPKMNAMTNMSGGTSLEAFRNQFRRAVADQTIKAIVIACDSPGGMIVGCEETWTEIMAARGTKPIVGSVDALMGSAALWVMSACDTIEMTPSGEGGSLGVFYVHEDASAAEAAAGVKITYVISDISPFKAEANEDTPLSDSARAHIQSRANTVAGTFLRHVAKGRGLPPATVQKTFGEGRTLFAPEALAVKMIDRIATFDQTVARLAGGATGRAGMRAASVRDVLAETDAQLEQATAAHDAAVDAAVVAREEALIFRAGVCPRDISDTLAPKDEPWSVPTLADFTDKSWADCTDMEKNRIAEHYAWARMMPPGSFSADLKLPHHRPSDGAVVFRGVVAALGRLDAMSDIPAADKAQVKAHLEHHEQQFADAEPKPAAAMAARATGPGSRQDGGCQGCSEACPCDVEIECPMDCPTCLPDCSCQQPAAATQAAADRDALAVALALSE